MFFTRKKKKLSFIDFKALLHKKQGRVIKAIWQNKDFDQPIEVIGYWGKSPDKEVHYVQIKGSMSGVPLNEILF